MGSKMMMGHNQFSTMTEDEKKKWRGNPAMWSKIEEPKTEGWER